MAPLKGFANVKYLKIKFSCASSINSDELVLFREYKRLWRVPQNNYCSEANTDWRNTAKRHNEVSFMLRFDGDTVTL